VTSANRRWQLQVLALMGALLGSLLVLVPTARAVPADRFYSFSNQSKLAAAQPGDILKSRVRNYHFMGFPTQGLAIQLLFRTTDAQGRPAAEVTTVLVPAGNHDRTKALVYGSAYDSLNPEDGPSRTLTGQKQDTGAGILGKVEDVFFGSSLGNGHVVIVPDVEGQNPAFGAGPLYGYLTLDAIRAAQNSPLVGLDPDARFGLVGYSGGAIATSWAAALAPSYAPEVNARIVGVAQGGLLVDPAHNLRYVGGSLGWSAVIPLALIGIARAYDVNLDPYLSRYGRRLQRKLQDADFTDAWFSYPGLTWQKLVRKRYANPNSVRPFIESANKINLAQAPTPTVPIMIGQGIAGWLEGTSGDNAPELGPGDGVMIAGDVRTLARQYCAAGTKVLYREFAMSHLGTLPFWAQEAIAWLDARFKGQPIPTNCGSIAPGNDLSPEVYRAAAWRPQRRPK